MYKIVFFLFLLTNISAQYSFLPLYEVECTDVKSQDRTGTCWSFATTSFIESELIRKGKTNLDLSEMFIVRNIYIQKAKNYILRQGKANFSQGSLAHDQINALTQYGVVPESLYPGNLVDSKHDHSELEKVLKGFLDGVIANKKPSEKWLPAFEAILDVYLGEAPSQFSYQGKEYDPISFSNYLGVNKDDYVGLTSFTHHPYGENFILEIPDNFSNGIYLNVPLNKLLETSYDALQKGYTLSWDGDVSEKSFSASTGLAILPSQAFDKSMFDSPVDEVKVTPQYRQDLFLDYTTTDDHLMHIVGVVKDQKGNKYFKVKNSWGEISDYKGFLYMSEAYFLAKTVSVYINKEVAPRY